MTYRRWVATGHLTADGAVLRSLQRAVAVLVVPYKSMTRSNNINIDNRRVTILVTYNSRSYPPLLDFCKRSINISASSYCFSCWLEIFATVKAKLGGETFVREEPVADGRRQQTTTTRLPHSPINRARSGNSADSSGRRRRSLGRFGRI